MSFVQRQLKFSFSGASTGDFSASGLRAYASIDAYSGRLGVQAQVRVWGLSLAKMTAYSSKLPQGVGVNNYNLIIEAGNVDSPLTQVINGTIFRSIILVGGGPDSAIDISVAGIYDSALPAEAQSKQGPADAAGMIASVLFSTDLVILSEEAFRLKFLLCSPLAFFCFFLTGESSLMLGDRDLLPSLLSFFLKFFIEITVLSSF